MTLEALQLVGVELIPLKVTVLVPCDAPKFAPEIVTKEPIAPVDGLRPEMLGGGGGTVKFTPLLAMPATVTTTLPVTAPAGTGTTMLVALQFVGVAAVPLNVTVLVPCVAPKFVPAIVTEVPAAPEVGLRLVMLGGVETINAMALLVTPPTVTTTFPVVAPAGTGAIMDVLFQLVGVAAVPLNVTALVP